MFKPFGLFILISCFCFQAYAKCALRQSYGLLNEGLLINDLATLSSAQMSGRKTGTIGSAKARRFIQSRFKTIGLAYFSEYPEFIQQFQLSKRSSDKQGFNIVGWIKGTSDEQQFIVVSAHYDHLGEKGRHVYYGADDNASGVATLLALASKVSELGLAHSVIFLATDAEEKGLYGAKAFIKNLPINKNAILLNINLDMLGEGGRRNKLYTTFSRGDEQLAKLVENVADTAALCLISGHWKSRNFSQFKQKFNWRKASDHAAFSKVGIPYLFVGGGVHTRYHTPKDNFENINQDFYISAAETAWLILQAADSYQAL
ncbi:M20/M25/M40 family metallo-hydrolase [uncultured Paraglaciecola sp.]|uniref:M20/M25/M40 family metallo-hydrolase n=1 Tax=uncultured Paraglaciecola sp. TaxID=1765024 RepID=UPI0030DA2E7B|tara:strand:+ start:70312 stop:71259 length:948 start_codon:yes stop_codon:yes gene_type:complete